MTSRSGILGQSIPNWAAGMSILGIGNGGGRDDEAEAPLFRSEMPDPYAASSSSLSPISHKSKSPLRHPHNPASGTNKSKGGRNAAVDRNRGRRGSSSSSLGSLPQLEISEELEPPEFEEEEEEELQGERGVSKGSRHPKGDNESSRTIRKKGDHSAGGSLLFNAEAEDEGLGTIPTFPSSTSSPRPQQQTQPHAKVDDSKPPSAARRGWLAHQSIFPSKPIVDSHSRSGKGGSGSGSGSKHKPKSQRKPDQAKQQPFSLGLESVDTAEESSTSPFTGASTLASGLTPSPASIHPCELESSPSPEKEQRDRLLFGVWKRGGVGAGMGEAGSSHAQAGRGRESSRGTGSGRKGRRRSDTVDSEEGSYDSDNPYELSTSSLSSHSSFRSSSSLSNRSSIDSSSDFNDPRHLSGPDPAFIHSGLDGVEIPGRLELLEDKRGYWAMLVQAEGGRERQAVVRRYKDPVWLAAWGFSLVGVLMGLCFVWGGTDASPIPPSAPPDTPISRARTPFSTLLHLIPLLAILVTVSAAASMGFLFLLRRTVRHVLIATALAIPFLLTATSWWAFIASFEDDSDLPPGTIDPTSSWWRTTGLRTFALVPLMLAGLFGRMVWKRRKRLERTVAVVELSSQFLLDHPPLLMLTPALLMVFAILSIPYMTLILRLLLIGYYRHPRENTWVWHVRPYADVLIVIVSLLWLWSWVIVKGIGRVVTASVVSEWFFHRLEPEQPDVFDLTVAALHRATGPNLGSICLSSLIVAVMRFLGRVAVEARRITNPRSRILPLPIDLVAIITPFFTLLAGLLDYVNGYALIYVGVTGEAFWPSARRAIGLAGRRTGGSFLDYTLIKLLLTLSSTAIALITAVIGYLYAAHALGAASHAPLAALLCGGVPFFAVRACAGVLGDASDALFICVSIDEVTGGSHCKEAKQAFLEDKPATRGATTLV